MVCGTFILTESAIHVYFYLIFNLRNLLYLTKNSLYIDFLYISSRCFYCFNAQKRPGFTGALQFKPVLLIVLQLLSYVAQTEREFNRQRQAEEIAATKARGVHFGCSFKDRGEDYRPVMDVWQRGELSGRAAAPEIGRGTQDLPVVM